MQSANDELDRLKCPRDVTSNALIVIRTQVFQCYCVLQLQQRRAEATATENIHCREAY